VSWVAVVVHSYILFSSGWLWEYLMRGRSVIDTLYLVYGIYVLVVSCNGAKAVKFRDLELQ
jgi:hypothetical protein